VVEHLPNHWRARSAFHLIGWLTLAAVLSTAAGGIVLLLPLFYGPLYGQTVFEMSTVTSWGEGPLWLDMVFRWGLALITYGGTIYALRPLLADETSSWGRIWQAWNGRQRAFFLLGVGGLLFGFVMGFSQAILHLPLTSYERRAYLLPVDPFAGFIIGWVVVYALLGVILKLGCSFRRLAHE